MNNIKEPTVINPFEEVSVDTRINDVDSLLRSHVHDGRETRGLSRNIPSISSAAGAPTTIPKKIGDIFVRTDTAKVYIACGTSATTDWKILN